MRFEKAAVAADNVMCSKIGRDIMKDKKGSAVDAIIATHHCVEVVNLHSTGLGGGGFMLVYEKKSGEFDTHNKFVQKCRKYFRKFTKLHKAIDFDNIISIFEFLKHVQVIWYKVDEIGLARRITNKKIISAHHHMKHKQVIE